MVEAPPPGLSPVAGCVLSADVGDPVGRAARSCAPDGSAAELKGCADGFAGVDVASTAFLKCMVGG
jgi:hypothetical protein